MMNKLTKFIFAVLLVGVMSTAVMACDDGEALQFVTLNDMSVQIEVGDTHQLQVVASGVKLLDGALWLSTDPTVASVDGASGLVTANSAGTTNVSVKVMSAAQEYNLVCQVTVTGKAVDPDDNDKQNPSTGLTLNQTHVTFVIGTGGSTTLSVTPAVGSFVWECSDTNILTLLDPYGDPEVTVFSNEVYGDATITVSQGDKYAVCTFSVRPANYLDLDMTQREVVVGDTFTVTASTSSASLSWASDDPMIATANKSSATTAVVAGLAVGTTTIRAFDTAAGLEQSVIVTVKGAPEFGRVGTESLSVVIGDTKLLSVTNNTGLTPTWASSDPAVTVVDGTVTAVSIGSAVVTASINSVWTGLMTANWNITVVPSPELSFGADVVDIVLGESATLVATLFNDTATGITYSVVSGSEFVSVEPSTGVVSTLGRGTAVVRASVESSYGTRTDECTVVVLDTPDQILTLDQTTVELDIADNKTAQLGFAVNKSRSPIQWSTSNAFVASVDANGVVTVTFMGLVANLPMNVTITATISRSGYADITATCTVTVKDVLVTVSLSKTSHDMSKSDSLTLSATVLPASLADKSVTWSSSDESVATVSGGVVTPVGYGTAIITATSVKDPSKFASCQVVVSGQVNSIAIDQTGVIVRLPGGPVGAVNATLTATVDCTDTRVTWSSSDNNIATVSATGVVTAVAKGTVTITATAVADRSKSASVSVSVRSALDSLAINTAKNSIKCNGESTTLAASSTPGTAGLNTVTWSTSDATLATVNASGVVTANNSAKTGTVTITATSTIDSSITATIQITITPVIVVIDLSKMDTPPNLNDGWVAIPLQGINPGAGSTIYVANLLKLFTSTSHMREQCMVKVNIYSGGSLKFAFDYPSFKQNGTIAVILPADLITIFAAEGYTPKDGDKFSIQTYGINGNDTKSPETNRFALPATILTTG